MKNKNNIVIIGSGISGLLSALILSENKDFNIHIVEQKDILGGLHGYFDYKEYGRFDYGAHNILETGIKELDNILISLLPKEEWNITSAVNDQKRTLTGIYYNDTLQFHTSCIDLRKYPKEKIDKIFNEILSLDTNINNQNELISVYDYSLELFGKTITDEVISKIMFNIFGVDAKILNKMCLSLLGISRICLLNKEELENINEEHIKNKLCYPQQREIPKHVLSSLNAYYPKKFGIYRIIDAIEEKFKNMSNVTVHKNSIVSNIDIVNNTIENISINNIKIKKIKYLVSSTNLATLSNLLNIKHTNLKYDKAPKTVLINILINQKLKMQDLSYFYCYDKKFKTFRVDNYYNYCGDGAIRKGLYPITMEMLLDEDSINKEELKILAINELREFGVLCKDTKVEFVEVEVLDYGFPLLTQTNIKTSNILRDEIESLNLNNLIKIGILSQKDLFFEGDIKIDLYNKLKGINK